MPPDRSTVNKDSHGHQSVITAWAKDDGKPKDLKTGASKEETEEWADKMTTWALRGSRRIVELQCLNSKHAALTTRRIVIGRENAAVLRSLQVERDTIQKTKLAINELIANLNLSKTRFYQLDQKAKHLAIVRRKIDVQRVEVSNEIARIKSELESELEE